MYKVSFMCDFFYVWFRFYNTIISNHKLGIFLKHDYMLYICIGSWIKNVPDGKFIEHLPKKEIKIRYFLTTVEFTFIGILE